MIDEKKIWKMVESVFEANDYAYNMSEVSESDWDISLWDEEQMKDAIEKGIRCGIQEFINSLWHDKDGSPSGRDRRTAWCLVEVETTSLSHSRKLLYVTARRLRGNWDQSAFSFLDEDPRVVCYEMKRWCYLSDLLPKEGGEK